MDLLKKLTIDMQWPLERSVPLLSTNAAVLLKLEKKGRLEVGMDADILLLGAEDLSLQYVLAKGQVLKGPNFMTYSMFEPRP
jgi:beta-aspartyl-dipeptidase (metallo-type)